jgi:YesN/AraC family two-component response regulator
MYKVLIVDDEEIIVEGLRRIVPWQKYGCEVVGTAFNVGEATRLIREHSPDILFTDIRMPDGDGLSMLAGLKAEFPDMLITVLTGYRDFNYAQQAIRLGVSRFLLKPSKMDELEEALEAMTRKLKPPLAEEPEDADSAAASEATSFVVRRAVAYIEEHHAEKISLADVAAACYVSQWHLSKLLSRYKGENFYDILNRARIDEAKRLMIDPSLKIGDISDMVGYSDTPHFSRMFKKLEGVSANEYRNANL